MDLWSCPLSELLMLGESQNVEFKASASLEKEAMKALCGMVNAASAFGVVVFGVNDGGSVCGLGDTNLDSFQRTLLDRARQKFDPVLHIQCRADQFEEKPVLRVMAQRERAIPLHEYDGRAYLRQGTHSVVLKIDERDRLNKERNRDIHPGPWQCDTCGRYQLSLLNMEIGANGMKRTYGHRQCGGEWWPA